MSEQQKNIQATLLIAGFVLSILAAFTLGRVTSDTSASDLAPNKVPVQNPSLPAQAERPADSDSPVTAALTLPIQHSQPEQSEPIQPKSPELVPSRTFRTAQGTPWNDEIGSRTCINLNYDEVPELKELAYESVPNIESLPVGTAYYTFTEGDMIIPFKSTVPQRFLEKSWAVFHRNGSWDRFSPEYLTGFVHYEHGTRNLEYIGSPALCMATEAQSGSGGVRFSGHVFAAEDAVPEDFSSTPISSTTTHLDFNIDRKIVTFGGPNAGIAVYTGVESFKIESKNGEAFIYLRLNFSYGCEESFKLFQILNDTLVPVQQNGGSCE